MSGQRVLAERKIPSWKVEEVEYLTNIFKKYRVFLIADLTGYPANQLQILRKKLGDKAVVHVSKNKLLLLAMKNAGIDTSLFENILVGQNLLIASNLNSFELANLIEQYRSKTFYKPGDRVDQEITIPSGNTGLPAGPLLSTFGKLKIPTRVEGNTIVIAKDTVVAKPGDVVSEELASLLQKLNMPLKDIILKIKVAYDDGVLIPGDKLKLNIDQYASDLSRAVLEALTIGVEIAWPVPEVLERSIVKGYREALQVAVEIAYPDPEVIEHVLKTAYLRAYMVAVEVSKQGVDLGISIAKPVEKSVGEEKPVEKKEEVVEEKKEAVGEEELAEGLGALFG